MNTDRRTTGADGEALAANYLVRRGWTILARNWRCRTGEIDLVARDPDGVVVVCEVKCRTGEGYGDPLEAITTAKLARLRALAAEWRRSAADRDGPLRLDAIGVRRYRDGTSRVTHVRGIDG